MVLRPGLVGIAVGAFAAVMLLWLARKRRVRGALERRDRGDAWIAALLLCEGVLLAAAPRGVLSWLLVAAMGVCMVMAAIARFGS
jgi:hypothetical protein